VGLSGYCFSGEHSGQQCNQKVTSTSAQLCSAAGCKAGVVFFTGGNIPASGDSGAPFYAPSGVDALIRGMVIGTVGPDKGYAEKWSRISSQLGVAIVTG
jgi:hypothetical protein